MTWLMQTLTIPTNSSPLGSFVFKCSHLEHTTQTGDYSNRTQGLESAREKEQGSCLREDRVIGFQKIEAI